MSSNHNIAVYFVMPVMPPPIVVEYDDLLLMVELDWLPSEYGNTDSPDVENGFELYAVRDDKGEDIIEALTPRERQRILELAVEAQEAEHKS